MIKIETWYQASKLDKEAGGGKEAVLAIAISLFLVPFDIAAIHWSRKFNKTPAEIGEIVTPDLKQMAWRVIEKSKTDETAAKFVQEVKNELEKEINESKVPSKEVDLSKWAEDIDIVAKTIYGEARGQGIEGMKAVASVIWNRANGNISKLKSESLKPKQFSCWNKGPVVPDKKSKVWLECEKIAKSMYSGGFTPITTGDHYFAYKGKYKVKNEPYWALNRNPVDTKGDHKFFDIF